MLRTAFKEFTKKTGQKAWETLSKTTTNIHQGQSIHQGQPIRTKVTTQYFNSAEKLEKTGISKEIQKEIQDRIAQSTDQKTGIIHPRTVYSNPSAQKSHIDVNDSLAKDKALDLGNSTHAPITQGEPNIHIENKSYCKPNTPKTFDTNVYDTSKEVINHATNSPGEREFLQKVVEYNESKITKNDI